MTTPGAPDRPANTRLCTLTAALVAAVGAVGLYLAVHTTPVQVELCTIGDSTNTQMVADVLRPSGAPSDTILPVDSTLIAHMDSASQAHIAGLHVLMACADLQSDTTVAPLTAQGSADAAEAHAMTVPP